MKLAHQNILTFSVILLIMMLGYQNCAPMAGETSDASDVGIVDPLTNFKVGFLSEDIRTNLSEDIYGICGTDQDGASLRWWAENLQGEVIQVGLAHCWEGEFSVFYEDLAVLSCSEDYVLHIEMGTRSHDQAQLLVDCVH